jgi:tetratricopeptide (TPR) repeat protein
LWLVQRDRREAAVVPSAPQESQPQAGAATPGMATGEAKSATPDRATLIAELARVEPPEYVALTMRAGDAAPLFDEAMVQYARGNFAEATKGLDAAASRAPKSSRIQFYRGIANLMVNRPERSVEAFDRAAQGDDAAYADPARFFRAKAKLRLGQLDAAMRDLEVVARGSSEHADASQRILNALR